MKKILILCILLNLTFQSKAQNSLVEFNLEYLHSDSITCIIHNFLMKQNGNFDKDDNLYKDSNICSKYLLYDCIADSLYVNYSYCDLLNKKESMFWVRNTGMKSYYHLFIIVNKNGYLINMKAPLDDIQNIFCSIPNLSLIFKELSIQNISILHEINWRNSCDICPTYIDENGMVVFDYKTKKW